MFNNYRGVWSVHRSDSIVLGVINLLNCKELLISEKESFPALTCGLSQKFSASPEPIAFGWPYDSLFTVRFQQLPGRRPSLPSSLKQQIASDTVCRAVQEKPSFLQRGTKLTSIGREKQSLRFGHMIRTKPT
ncbi:uncharacterized protein TNCV_1977751 [Trichonephila clavipes]|nr:uncharacterized protein TNCV_1977751 [Trichonephila clavipes]